MIATTPRQGGATWAVLQYLLGLRALGCDVYFVEPVTAAVSVESIQYCAAVMRRFELDDRWSLLGADGQAVAGLARDELHAVARRAEILLNISGMLTQGDLLAAVSRRVYLDLDPAFAQLWHSAEGIDMHLDAHTHFVTVADAIGRLDCPIPDCGRSWLPTLPPVVLREWPMAGPIAHEAFTTIGHWRGYGSIVHEGVHFGQKAHSLRRFVELPARTPERFLLALAIDPGEQDDVAALAGNGWALVDPADVAPTPDDYWRFVQGSRAELGVTKSGYVVSGSGWFSDRSACYLASGRPVVAQDTGFGRRLPTGAGLFAFSDTDDVLAAAVEIRSDYERHRAAARAIAEEYLDADRVLRSLLDRVGS